VAGAIVSQHQAFRRVAVPAQVAQRLDTITFPAPTRGIIQTENESFMQPGAAVVCDNWRPTMKGVALRGGCDRWAVLPETTPIYSAFNYDSGIIHKMFMANAAKIYDVSTSTPVLVKSGQTSGNYRASQLATAGGDWLLAVNDNGDFPLRFNGTSWVTLDGTPPPNWANNTAYVVGNRRMDTTDRSYWKCAVAHTSAAAGTFAADRAAHPTFWTVDLPADGVSWITGPAGSNVVGGGHLTYVCKYRNRLFFIEQNSMNAWYLPLNAVGGLLAMIPLSGAATEGGKLLFCTTWSIDAGDGIDDKLVFATDLGELLIFTGSNPSDAANWRQEGRYEISPPMGMNAHIAIGGDLLIATVDGIVPISGAITKSRAELELAAITRSIKPIWRAEVLEKREWPWTMCKWDEYGAIFVAVPGSAPGKERCLVVNAATGAWARYTGWDATCFARMRGDMFFGTQHGVIMQADRTGYDDGLPYVATLVGGWEVFQSPSQTVTWRQARASFSARAGEPFQPQLSATTDYVVVLPPPPVAGPDPGLLDLWDQGLWDSAKWDAGTPTAPSVRNTGWVSIGITGFSHAPIVQVTVAQQAKPEVDLISIAATFERDAVTV
jgi:hypothetical protein